MSGETEANVSGWTTDTLRTYLERLLTEHDRRLIDLLDERDLRYQQRFDAQQLGVRDALTSAQTAVAKAEAAAERRFELQNEFRNQLGDQARTFLPRLEYDRAHTDLIERVDQMRTTFADHLSLLDKRAAESAGRGRGLTDGWGYLVGAIGVIATIVGVALMFSR